MKLPVIDKPLYQTEIPSSGQIVQIRPFMVGEEKILLSAKETKDRKQILLAISQVVDNCVVTSPFDVGELTVCDMEYLFLKLRSHSVGNEVKMVIVNDETKINITIDLDDVSIKRPERDIDLKIKVGENQGYITLRYPKVKDIRDMPKLSAEQAIDYLIYSSIDKIFIDDEVYDPQDMTFDTVIEWIDKSLDIAEHEKIKTFLENMPTLYYQVNYKDADGEDRSLELTTLQDFFTS